MHLKFQNYVRTFLLIAKLPIKNNVLIITIKLTFSSDVNMIEFIIQKIRMLCQHKIICKKIFLLKVSYLSLLSSNQIIKSNKLFNKIKNIYKTILKKDKGGKKESKRKFHMKNILIFQLIYNHLTFSANQIFIPEFSIYVKKVEKNLSLLY